MDNHHIRPYRNEDKQALIALFRLNTPEYFDPSEEADYAMYLDNYSDHYFVVEENGRVIGAGGFNYSDDKSEAHISWDIIHPESHGKGIGRALLLHRLEAIHQGPPVRQIGVRTSQLAHRFYEKMGFELIRTEKDFWAPGFDLYHMHWVSPDSSADRKV